jgi:hypothetical protein
MCARRDGDHEAAVSVAHDLARSKPVAAGRIFDRETLPVNEAQGPITRRWRFGTNEIDTARIERCADIVGARDELQTFAGC